MNEIAKKNKVQITVRGIANPLEDVRAMLGFLPDSHAKKGDPLRAGRSQTYRDSYFLIEQEFDRSVSIDDALTRVLERCGGSEKLLLVIETLKPNAVEVDFVLWVKGSLEQDSAVLSAVSLERILALRASVAISFM